ncbi:MAG: DUF3857 domain-containing protein [Sandaracinaceae bacterium]
MSSAMHRSNGVRALIALLGLFALAACSGASHGTTPTIDELRRRASENPNDPDAQRALAEGELLLRDGDAARARAAIDRARELDARSIGLVYLSANERELHGDLDGALTDYLEVLTRAARSRDPRAWAFAEVAAAEVEGLDDAVDHFADRVVEALTPLLASPGAIGPGARATVADLLIDIAYRRGDVARVREVAQAAGCADEWRVAGPFGPRHLLGFDAELAPESDAALGGEYDYGPGRGVRATRAVRARGCNVHLGLGTIVGPGTTYAETGLTVPSAGRYLVRLETPNAVQLFVDGASVARVDRRSIPVGRVTYHAVELSAGAHTFRVKLSSRHPNPVVHLSLVPAEARANRRPIEDDSLTSAFLAAQQAMSEGDIVRGRERLASHLAENGSPVFLIAGAAAALNDPLREGTERHDRSRQLLSWAAERDLAAWYPRLTLAQLEANEGRDIEAIGLLREAREAWPGVIAIPLQLIDYLEARGWIAAATPIVTDTAERIPSACRPRRALMSHARLRHRADEAMVHAHSLVECDARSDAQLTLHVARREWEPAAAELARLATLEPEASTIGELQARLDIARARGDDEAVQATLESLREHMPLADTLVLLEADRLLATRTEQAARQEISSALTREPAAMSGLRRALRAIGGPSPLEGYRRDGAEVIREFEASGRRYEEPMVLVLDYTVYRVFEDGSMLELTHNIFRLDSQEAVDSMGEFEVPENAHMLTLHTVKADGTRLEPDEIAGKDTLSFPNLAVGDYIEFEYMRPTESSAGYPGGFVGDRFYFRNYETPFDLSQLTVVTPEELEVDPRGQAPETEHRQEDGLHVYRWTARESRPFVQEPASVSAREFFPSIYWGRGARWEDYVASLRDVLADRDVHDPAAERLVEQIAPAARTRPEERAQRIHAWVLENIEDSNDVFGLTPAMLAARTGNRARVLAYLLRLAGFDAEIALARSYTSDSTRAELADDDTYQHLLVRLTLGGEVRWLYAGARGVPFDYLPPHLRGMDALMLDAEAERVTVADRDLESDLRTVRVELELRGDGGARLEITETFRGSGAVLWRNQLEEIPDAELEPQFESAYVANLLPSAQLSRLVVTGREDPEAPLVLRYDLDVAQLARPSRGSLALPPIYRARLGPQYARVASRTTTQLVGEGLALDVEIHVRAPDGGQVRAGSSPTRIDGPGGSAVRIQTTGEGAEATIRRSYRIPRMRIEADAYEDFAQFCRQADEAESAELTVAR